MSTAPGGRRDKQKIATADLQRRGPRLSMRGVVNKRGNTLEYEDDIVRARLSAYFYDFADESHEKMVRRMAGQTITVNCHIQEIGTFIQGRNCTLENASVSAATAGTPVFPAGFRRKAIPRETLATAPGSGLKPSEVEGVYVIQKQQMGVGGYLYIACEPAMVLQNGLYYDEPHYAPDSFNAPMSQQKEPQNWGKLTRSGDKGKVVWLEPTDGDGEDELTQIIPAKPGPADLRLNGTYSHLGGGGSTAVGGETVVYAESSFTFRPDGSFQTGRFRRRSQQQRYGAQQAAG